MIKAKNLSYSYTQVPLFEKANFTVSANQKVGLAGPNGAGKSTLFSLILGKLQPDSGKVEITGTVCHVPQEVRRDELLDNAQTIHAYVDPKNIKSEFELKRFFVGLELEHLKLEGSPRALSGGQKTKLALLRALIQEPDILLLDEPTNFLDTKGKKWVMDFLSRYPKTLILISHDLKLLDQSISKIIAINPMKRTLEEYNGNFTTYLSIKKQQDELLNRIIVTEQKHLVQMKKGLQKMDRYTSEKGVRQRTQLKKRIRKIQDNLPELPQELKSIRFKLLEPSRVGEVPIIAKNITKSFDKRVIFDNVTFSIKRFERVALIGQNGAGKSTFIKTLLGIFEPDTGEVLRDEQLTVGYYSQEFENFDMDDTIMQAVYKHTKIAESIVRSLLARFMFKGDKIFQTVGTLSGGEKTRLSIALLLLQNFNLLILDEPTTYLDVLSQRVILEALKSYKGTMLVVSHTEEFIKELKPSKALLLPENQVVEWSDELIDRVSEI